MIEQLQHTHIDTHRQLQDFSRLCNLPVKAPDVLLYSLERTDGKRSIVHIGDIEIGGTEIVLMAGPCSVENPTQAWEAAIAAKEAGATVLRGGVFKPRTSPYTFQGMGPEGLILQRAIADNLGMRIVTESTGESNTELVAQYADIIQTGARNAQSFEFLAHVGSIAARYDRAVLYKRGAAMSVQEFLWGAEYILAAGCKKVLLCERGTLLSNGHVDFDVEGVEAIKSLTHLPIIGDPTHAVKESRLVRDRARKAISAGCDGLIVETHPNPEQALSDGARALRPEELVYIGDDIVHNMDSRRTFCGNARVNKD